MEAEIYALVDMKDGPIEMKNTNQYGPITSMRVYFSFAFKLADGPGHMVFFLFFPISISSTLNPNTAQKVGRNPFVRLVWVRREWKLET